MSVNRFSILALVFIPFLPLGILNNVLIFLVFIFLVARKKVFYLSIIICFCALFFYLFINPFFNVGNYLVACISWFPFLILLVDRDLKFQIKRKDKKWLNILFYGQTGIAIFQMISILTIFKSLDLGFGDYIQGSLNILSPFNKEIGFNTQLFIISYLFLFFIIRKLSEESLIKLDFKLFLFLTIMFAASVLHVNLVFFLAIFISLIELKNLNKILSYSLLVIISLLIMAEIKQDEYNLLVNSFGIILQLPKISILVDFFNEPNWFQFFFGYGPGNGVDRVLFYLTDGGYNYPKLGLHISENLKDYANMYLSYKENVQKFGNSTLYRPFSSIISILYNYGLFGIIFLTYIFVKLFELNDRKKFLIFFLLGISFFETYIELPVVSIMFLVALRIQSEISSGQHKFNFKLVHNTSS